MLLKLNVYTDDALTDVKRVAEADKLKIPYRVAIYIAQTLDTVDLKTEDDLFKFVINNLDKLDKIIRATFSLSESELECVDIADLGAVGVELYKWGVDKLKSLKSASGDEKNA